MLRPWSLLVKAELSHRHSPGCLFLFCFLDKRGRNPYFSEIALPYCKIKFPIPTVQRCSKCPPPQETAVRGSGRRERERAKMRILKDECRTSVGPGFINELHRLISFMRMLLRLMTVEVGQLSWPSEPRRGVGLLKPAGT